MIHIVFETANVKALQTAMEMDELLQGEILEIKDDFAVGPIAGIYETEGYQQRRDWWKEVVQFSPYENQLDIVDDKLTVHNLMNTLTQDESQEAWIWMGQNAHDVSGYYWLMSQLASFAGRIQVLYLNNLPFFNEKGSIFYPTHLHEIQPREFLKAKKLARPITLSEFEIDPDEWKKICGENAMVRFLEGGKKIVGKEVTYFDKSLLLHITKDVQKLNKVIGSALNKMTVQTGDAFLVWRLRILSNEGVLVINGDLAKGWKEWTVQLASA
ncbi:DUF1835 domain-containing protein [Sediminibacterium sp.]|uniref:DUF1835 domain-containing protein n=1 Tax=Sediminibacterium sp. TaxID=1917865 RepID=UPI00271E6EE9|nr:DUF1835 domain-containing protein [Sediminibacterium sp.]MDO9156751.1 DUF1835 domain-containing protein [Sediminibacterium sp.]MDP2420976.1 DUF1835 domain-containing protein [Sediminibacterium sp.]